MERRRAGPAVVLRLPSARRAPIDETYGPRHAVRWEQLGLPAAHERVELRTHAHGDRVTHEATVPEDRDDISRVGVRPELPPGVVAVDWARTAGATGCVTVRQAMSTAIFSCPGRGAIAAPKAASTSPTGCTELT